MHTNSGALHRIQWLLFAAAFISFAWFHQGGGWNQNVRFAMVRAMVEEGHFWIDSYLIYSTTRDRTGNERLGRIPVRNAEFIQDGKKHVLSWRDADGKKILLNGDTEPKAGTIYVEPGEVAASGDLSFHGGHFHPAKAPGMAFVSVPAYFLIHTVESIAGIDPDDWQVLTINAWLTSVFSVGLLSALGCVLFFRLARLLSDGRTVASLLATLAFAFGTMYFPYATMLYEHNVIAVALLASFYLLFRVKHAGAALEPSGTGKFTVALAGFCAGYAAFSNYIMAAVAIMLGVHLVIATKQKRVLPWYALGLLIPFVALCAYNQACFSTPFTTNYAHEDPSFKAGAGALLGVFLMPQWEVIPKVLFSPYRGLFFSSPVLLAGVYGLYRWFRSERLRQEAWLIVAILVFFLLFISTFNGWHGGWAVGPRYLIPALPFLALPAIEGFRRFLKSACILAVVSSAFWFLVTAVDPQSPVGNAPFALVEGKPDWRHNPLSDYELPLFISGRALPLMNAQRDHVLGFFDSMLRTNNEPAASREQRVVQLKHEIDEAIHSGKPAPLQLIRGADGQIGATLSDLPTFSGPVSVNPVGIHEGWFYRQFPPHSRQTGMNSFNAGEFLFPHSRLSLLFPVAALAMLIALALRLALKMDHNE